MKINRAAEHLDALRKVAEDFRQSGAYTLTAEKTGDPDLTAYRLRLTRPFPTPMLAIIGDILHNQRAALEALAYELARVSNGGVLGSKQEGMTTFPICASPDLFDKFIAKRPGLYSRAAIAAMREVQPFRQLEQAHELSIAPEQTFEEEFRWNELHCLNTLWNIDKHRRLSLLVWRPDMIWWSSNGDSNRRMLPGDGTLTDGSILFYMKGRDENQGDTIYHEFNIVLADDPAHPYAQGVTRDVVEALAQIQGKIANWVFPTIFSTMS